MFGKLPNELLPDHSGRAENAYVDFFRLHDVLHSPEGLAPDSPHASLATSCLARAAVRFTAQKKPAGLLGPAGVVILL